MTDELRKIAEEAARKIVEQWLWMDGGFDPEDADKIEAAIHQAIRVVLEKEPSEAMIDARRFLFMVEQDLTELYSEYWEDGESLPDDFREAIDAKIETCTSAGTAQANGSTLRADANE